jgi:hypothetical protein
MRSRACCINHVVTIKCGLLLSLFSPQKSSSPASSCLKFILGITKSLIFFRHVCHVYCFSIEGICIGVSCLTSTTTLLSLLGVTNTDVKVDASVAKGLPHELNLSTSTVRIAAIEVSDYKQLLKHAPITPCQSYIFMSLEVPLDTYRWLTTTLKLFKH